MASADIRSIQETTSGARFTYDPHEVITVDVINRLTDAGFINPGSPKFAPHGALVLAKGTLVFLDRSMVQLGVLAFDTLVSAEKTKPKSQQNANLIASLGFLKSLMNGISIPSAFLLATPDGVQIAGTIKELGMEEPISTYYFRHGTAGLSDVYLLGIKEIASTALSLPGKDLMAAGQQAAKALHEMLFPADAIRVTPILMYRKL
jgi:hypothetical protein